MRLRVASSLVPSGPLISKEKKAWHGSGSVNAKMDVFDGDLGCISKHLNGENMHFLAEPKLLGVSRVIPIHL